MAKQHIVFYQEKKLAAVNIIRCQSCRGKFSKRYLWLELQFLFWIEQPESKYWIVFHKLPDSYRHFYGVFWPQT